MHVFEMAAEVATLREGLPAHGAVERSLSCVLAEVIAQVAAFLEDTLAPGMLAFEIVFDALSDSVSNLDCLMPLLWNAFEMARLDASDDRVDAEL